jgi:hypothetical protein
MKIKLSNGRFVTLEKGEALKVLTKQEELKIRDEQIVAQIREAHMGPRSEAGSQFAPWIGKNTPKKSRQSNGIIYSV